MCLMSSVKIIPSRSRDSAASPPSLDDYNQPEHACPGLSTPMMTLRFSCRTQTVHGARAQTPAQSPPGICPNRHIPPRLRRRIYSGGCNRPRTAGSRCHHVSSRFAGSCWSSPDRTSVARAWPGRKRSRSAGVAARSDGS